MNMKQAMANSIVLKPGQAHVHKLTQPFQDTHYRDLSLTLGLAVYIISYTHTHTGIKGHPTQIYQIFIHIPRCK